jgi:hypothetical protein
MSLLKNRSMRFYFVFFLILALAIGGSVAAFADSPSATVSVSGAAQASESGATFASASPVVLDGTDHHALSTLSFNVYDNRGTGAGWSLTIAATTFTTGTCLNTDHNLGVTPNNFNNGASQASKITAVSVSDIAGGTYTDPTNDVGYTNNVYTGVQILADCTGSQSVKFFRATAGSGLGQFTIKPTIDTFIPASTYVGTYSSTLTLTFAQTP